jgi:long-subunit acyl-CoA synthetase (AMP-forming)
MIDYSKLEFATVNDVFERMSHRGEATVAMWKSGSEWKEISSQQMYGRVRALVGLLQQWGIKRGERVGLVSENRWEWPVVDFAVLAIGAVDVPLYDTLTPEQMGYILRDAGVRAVIVSNKLQFKKLVAAGDIPTLEFVGVLDEGEFEGATSLAGAFERAKELEGIDAGFDAMLKETKPEELATIVYTSGTTGDPKGVMLTHRNLADNLRYSTVGLRIGPGDATISFLPLSHSLARHLGYAIYGSDAVGEAADFSGGAARVREDSAGNGSEVGRIQKEDSALGDGAREEASQGNDGREDAVVADVEAGRQAGVLEIEGGVWGEGEYLRVGWSAAGDGFGGVVSGYGDQNF